MRDARAPDLHEIAGIYELAATVQPDELDALLTKAASSTPSATRQWLLYALLLRYAEHDIDAALDMLLALDIDYDLVGALCAQWVHTKPDAVLAALAQIEDQNVRWRLVQQVGSAWASANPREAFSASTSIRNIDLRSAYERMVLGTWFKADVEEFLQYLSTFDAVSQQRLIDRAITSDTRVDWIDPFRLIDLAEPLAPGPARALQSLAIQAVAEADARLAVAIVEQWSMSSAQRFRLHSRLAPPYAQQHPAEAFDWAERTGDRRLVNAVLDSIARNDPEQALSFALSGERGALERVSFNAIFAAGAASGVDMTSLAQRVLAIDSAQVRQRALRDLAWAWVQSDPAASIAWLLAQADQIGPGPFAQIARRAAEANASMALAYVDRIPEEAVGEWTAAAVSRYAEADPEAALQWVAGRRGQPGYAAGVRALAEAASATQLAEISRWVAGLDSNSDEALGAAADLVFYLTQSEGIEAAAQWAATLPNAELMSAAAPGVSREWAQRDVDAARAWALGLPYSTARDGALTWVWLGGVTNHGRVDHALLAAFTSSDVREQAIVMGLESLLAHDESAARELVARYVSSPVVLAQVEQIFQAYAARAPHASR